MKWFDIPDELLPPAYKSIKDMYAYARTLDTELRNFLLYLNRILQNFFVQTCDLQTIEYWEELLDITLFGDETIEERRQNILLYLNNNAPTTEAYVRQVLTNLFGAENYNLWFDVETGHPYDLYIEIFDTPLENIEKFMFWFLRMCPAHIRLNTGHTENAVSHFSIYAHAESDHEARATVGLNPGTAVIYLGPDSYTVDTVEI